VPVFHAYVGYIGSHRKLTSDGSELVRSMIIIFLLSLAPCDWMPHRPTRELRTSRLSSLIRRIQILATARPLSIAKHSIFKSSITLAIYAACANVAHLSGAGEYIDTVDRDIDAIRVLVKDGSSDTVLAKSMTRIWITA
jgi:hypothetical protein